MALCVFRLQIIWDLQVIQYRLCIIYYFTHYEAFNNFYELFSNYSEINKKRYSHIYIHIIYFIYSYPYLLG